MSYTSERLKEIEKAITLHKLISVPAVIMIGLGLYALFGSNGEPFAKILANYIFVYSMLALGLVIELWNFSKLIPLWSERGVLLGEE